VAAAWRDVIFVTHYRVGAGSYCGPGHFIDGVDNNFIAIRSMPNSKYGNFLYAEFQWANGNILATADCQCYLAMQAL
jgi:hypothetical protein